MSLDELLFSLYLQGLYIIILTQRDVMKLTKPIFQQEDQQPSLRTRVSLDVKLNVRLNARSFVDIGLSALSAAHI